MEGLPVAGLLEEKWKQTHWNRQSQADCDLAVHNRIVGK
jgi:hypothetical protein